MARVWFQYNEKYKELDSGVFLIGSDPSNHLVLSAPEVREIHAEIRKAEQGFELVARSPGVFINKLAVEKEILAHGDIIRISRFEMTFDDPPGANLYEELPSLPDSGYLDLSELSRSEVSRSVSESDPFVEELYPLPADKGNEFTQPDPQLARVSASEKELFVLYKTARTLNSVQKLPDTLEQVLEIILRHLEASRAGVFLLNKTGDLELSASRNLSWKDEHEKATVMEILRTSIMDNTARLCADACYDPELVREQRVSVTEVRSVLSVPLWESEEILGALYVDNEMEAHAFNEHDLEFLAAIAGQIAVKVRQEKVNEEFRKNALLQANLERFHSPDVARMIQDHSSSEEESSFLQEREATILFADISNFTTLLERLDPPAAAGLLNSFFDEMTSVIFEYHGTVDKFIGDAVMANFGAPVSHGNDAELAVFAAIEMMKKTSEFKAAQKEEEKFDIRIGINTGVVIAGYMGSRTRIEYSVLGDPVNIAARLQHIASPGSILAGESTYVKVSGLFNFRDKGLSNLKGKKKTTRVYEVIY